MFDVFVRNVTYMPIFFELTCILYFANCMFVIQLFELLVKTCLSLALSLSDLR